MDMVSSAGELVARFSTIRILHPLATNAFEIFETMRECRRKSPANTEQHPGTFFAESHAGKSTTINMYMETKVVDDCIEAGLYPPDTPRDVILALQKKVVCVTLPAMARIKPVITELLRSLGDPAPDSGNVQTQTSRLGTLFRGLGVELLILDEVDHLATPLPRNRLARETANSVHNSLKLLLIKGIPVMFVGVPEARDKLFNEDQVAKRESYKVKFTPLDYFNSEHHVIFKTFAAHLSISLKEKGIMGERSDFLSGDILPCMFAASGGLLGGTARLVCKAAEYAFRDGAARVERKHLIEATDDYAIPAYIDYNPFTQGLRDVSLHARRL